MLHNVVLATCQLFSERKNILSYILYDILYIHIPVYIFIMQCW